ncbi:dihydrolipoamide acetyltransferase family protein [Kribbella shirazensis]|uniref:Dihydrolipoamide acetyltransferase component of pyruvate dehydrogenase complex n=1 Tax=Kribbella shirazensis TaxID=1105143 RepID=A0A7X5VJV1_9ACTN|nr:dihydrolipoamide acetyltransferase family protein [Kribbella shirazensis]NIK61433.1 pyruvate dehydrogenase E2 component (dihydrolipoamide acetyltransferase) [Kribbella shirazensis]
MTAREFRLPDIGEGLVEAEILRWAVPVGGQVAVDEILVEVETAKTATDIPSPYAGTVIRHGAAEGEIIVVGDILAVVGDPGDVWPAPQNNSANRSAADGAAAVPASAPVSGTGADAMPIVGNLSEDATELRPVATGVGVERDPSVVALPLVRKVAKELGVDLQQVTGSGPGGRITRKDVEAAASAKSDPQVAPGHAASTPAGGERRRMSTLRRTIAANMSRSWAEIPHVTSFDEADASRLLSVRNALQNRHGVSIPIDALVIAAIVPALREVPVFNARLEGEDLVYHDCHDIGIAVNTPEGLLVAVVKDAGAKSVLELAADVRRLSEQARDRSLPPGDVSGQTFTLSNTGAAGGGFGTPIIPPGTIGVLATGRAKDKPVARNQSIEIATMMPLSFSYDHRVADGAVGRRFLAMVVENLTEPALFLTAGQ